MTEDQNGPRGDLTFSTGDCASCGRPTASPLMSRVVEDEEPEHDEPFICNRCLVEIKREVYTELELRNRVTRLEATAQSLGNKVWMLSTLFSVAGIVVGYVLKTVTG